MALERCSANGASTTRRHLFAFLHALGVAGVALAGPLPDAPNVTAGAASVATAGQVMTVRQTTDRAAISWDGFSVGAGHAVNFEQPSARSVLLNRVVGADPSVIQGSLTANGRVFLLNPNGVLFSPTSQVNVGGIVASTLAMTDADFMAGRYALAGASSSAVINQGNLVAQPDGHGGFVVLVAAKVLNEGTISAAQGSVRLAAAGKVTLSLGGVVGLELEQGAVDALVANGGAILAPGGQVLLTATAAGGLPSATVNHTGLIEAQTLVTGEKGRILLLAPGPGGLVTVAGRLDVSAPGGGDGGFIDTSAAKVAIAPEAFITALAPFGRTGTWLLDPDVINIFTSGTESPGSLPAFGETSISPATLNAALTTANVDLQANSHIDFVSAFTYTGSRDAVLGLYAPRINLGADIGSSTAFQLGLNFGGTYAGNATNYAGHLYLYDATGGGGLTRTLTTQGGAVHFYGNIGGALNLTIAAGGGTIVHHAPVDGNFTALVRSPDTTVSLDFKPGVVNAHIVIDYGTQILSSEGVPIAFTGTMPYGFIRLPAQTLNLNAQKVIHGSTVNCIMTLVDGSTVTFTPLANGNVVVPTALQVTKIEYYTSNASAANFNATGVAFDVLVQATKLLSYSATAGTFTVEAGAKIDVAGAITVVTGRFDNQGGTGALVAGVGQDWRVWSSNPDPYAVGTGDVVGGLAYDYKQYNLAYTPGAVGLLGTGDGLIYTYAPTLSASLVGTVTKTYDGLITATNLTLANYAATGAVGGDTISFITGTPTAGTYATADVGSALAVSVTGITLGNIVGSNRSGAAVVYGYGLTSGAASGSIGGITPAPLTITANAFGKTYDGLAYSGGNGVTYAGFVNGETQAVLGGAITYAGSGQGAVNAGSYIIIPQGQTSTNYAISYAVGALTVGLAPLTLTANNDSKIYDGQAYTGGNGVTYAGFVNGETESVLGGSVTFAGTSQGAINLGSYTIIPGGRTSSNYAITSVAGTLEVNQVILTITANAATKTYDGLAYGGGNGVTYAGFVGGDTPASLGGTLTFIGSSQGAINAGSYVLTPAGQTSANYAITFTGSTLTVNQAALTITANAAAKTYDGLAYSGGNGVSYSGFVNGETAAVLGGALSYLGTSQGAINVGGYVLTPGGQTSANYAISFVDGALTVGQAGLTVIANAATKTYDGLAYNGGNGVAYAGFVNGETTAVLGGALAFSGASQGAINAGSYTLAPGGQISGNYAISFVDGTLTVNQAALTITANAATKTYDGLAYSGGNGVVYTGFVNGETAAVLGGALAYSGASQGAINASSYALTPGGQTSGNYAISFVDGALTVNQAALTITANAATKTYDGLAYSGGNGVSYSGFVNGETAAVLGGALSYLGTSQGAINVGGYVLTPGGQTSGNYAISFVDGALTVGQAGLTVTANAATKTYDGLAYTGGNGVAYAGFVNGETDAVLGGALTYSGTSQGAINVGGYVLTPGGQTSGNYAISFVGNTLTVNQAALTVTANAATKTYDGLAFTGGNGVVYTGFVNGETDAVLGGALTYSGASQSAINAGSYTLTPGGQTSGNYAITFVGDSLTVNQAGLTITANAATKTYDGLAYTGGNGVAYSGFVNGETDAVLGGALAYSGTSQGAINAGSYVLTPGGQTSGNYTISFVDNTLTVNQAGLTVTANAATKTYDGLAYNGGNGVAYAGFVNGETDAVLGGALTYSGASQGAINAGSFVLTPGGQTSGNYAISFVDGVLTVGQAGLTITANAATKTYDGLAYNGGNGVSYVGFVNGETAAVLGGALAYSGASQGAINAGSYTLTPGGQTSGNYAISFVDGALTVGQAGLTITANAVTKTYDGLAYTGGNGVAYAGFVNGETDAVLGGALAYSGSSQGAINVGNYVLTPGGQTSGNYAITFVGDSLAVNQAGLTIAANAATKTYDGLAYSGGSGVAYAGFVNGETDAVLGGALAYSGASQGAINAGSYVLTPGGQTSGNYAITYTGSTLTVGQAGLSITANAATKTYDGLAFTGGNGVSYVGLVNGETDAVLGGALAYSGASQGAINAGSYTLTPGGQTSGNYAISFVGDSLAVNQAGLTIAANTATKTYDGLAFTGGNGVAYAGFVNGETAAVLGGTLAYSGDSQGAVNAGSYILTPGGQTSANYTISFVDNTLMVGQAGLTVTANAATKTYDGLAFTGGNGVSYVGFVNGETDAVLGGALAYSGASQGAINAGSYVLTPGGQTSANYAITFVDNTLAVNQAGLTITANAATKTYDGLAFTSGNGVAYSGFVNGETDAVLGGALAYSGASQGAINAGSYVLTPGGQTSGNYAISFVDGALTVNQAALTITANAATKTYDGLAFTSGNGVVYSGFVNGETAAVLGGALAYSGTSQGAINAGSYALTPGGQTSGNYAITYTGSTLTVGQAALTITANAATKTYDGLAYSNGNGVVYTGFVNGETDAVLGGALAYSGASQGAINVGSYVLTPGGQTSGNYAISYTDSALTVGQAGLIISANDATKTYDGLAYNGGNGVVYTGFVNGETDAVLGGALAYSGSSQGAINVGSYVLTPVGQTSANYAIAFVDNTLAVNQAGLTITANAVTKTYDGLSYSNGNGVAYSGFVNGETAAVLGGALTYSGTSQGAINAGSFVLTPGGQTSGNYAISFVDGALTVGQAGLTITAYAATKTYDGLAYSGGNGVAYAGFVNGETAAVLGGALAYSGASQGAINAGSYALTPGGETSANYAITFVGDSLTVNQAALTITANASTKTYDGLAYTGGNGVAYAGFVNGETDAVLGGALAYSGNSQGAINVGGYTLTPGGQTSGNYAITFVGDSLTVNQAGLTITANAATKTHDGYPYAGGNGVTYVGFVNGETEAVLGGALTYGGTAQGAIEAGNYTLTVSGQTSGNYALTYVGDTLTIRLGDTVDPIPYLLHPVKPEPSIVLTQTLDSLSPEYYVGGLNYVYANLPAVLGAVSDVAFVAAAEPDLAILRYDNGTLLVKRDPLGITSTDTTKVYDALAYSGGNGVTYVGFVKGETAASLGGANVAGGTSQGAVNVGAYTMTGSGQTSGDYDITYIDGRLLVTKAPLTITSTGRTKTYDALAYLGGAGVTYEGFVGGQTSASLGGALVYGGTSQGATAPGSYTMTSSGLTSGNYALTYGAGTLLINRAALTVTSADVTKLYDDIPYAGGGGVVYAGFVGGQSVTALGGEVVYGGTSQGAVLPGTYVLMPSGHTSANYAITYLAGTLTIKVGGLAIASAEPLVPQFNPDPFALLSSPFEAGSPGRRREVADAVPPPAVIRNAVLPRPRKVVLGVLSGDAGAPIELKVLPRSIRPPVDVFIIKGGLNTGPRFILAE